MRAGRRKAKNTKEHQRKRLQKRRKCDCIIMYMYGLAASVFGSCRQWLTAWITVHLMVVLALIRGVSSGGGIFAAELDKWQVSW